MKLIFNLVTKNLLIILVFVVLAKFIGLVAFSFLPKHGEEFAKQNLANLPFRSYKISTIFAAEEKEEQTKQLSKPKSFLNISNIILHGIYGNKDFGFIVISKNSDPSKAYILALHEEFEGYTLKQLKAKSAILSKNNNEYELQFSKDSTQIESRISDVVAQDETNLKGSEGALRLVSKKDVMYYAKNFKQIWKNIAITEVKRNGKIDGFKVISVNASSIFAKLGLNAGDVIKSVNNQPLSSYADAFKIYNNISNYDALKITVIRNNQTKELEYEIH